jgi:hypothetical protein
MAIAAVAAAPEVGALFGGAEGEAALNLFGGMGKGHSSNSKAQFQPTHLKEAMSGWSQYHMDTDPSGGMH